MPQSLNPLSAIADRINGMAGSAAGQPSPAPATPPVPPAGAPPQQLQPGMLEKLAMFLASLRGQPPGPLSMNSSDMQQALASMPKRTYSPRQWAPITDTFGPLSVPFNTNPVTPDEKAALAQLLASKR